MSNVDVHVTDWKSYWSSASIKRRFIEYIRHMYFAGIFAEIIQRHAQPSARVLEAGCGSGTYLKFLEEKGLKSVGLDLSEAALLVTRKNCENVVGGDLFYLPFKDNAFDVVYNQGVMEHFDNIEFVSVLEEMSRITQKVIIIVPSNRSVFRIYDPFGDDPGKRFFAYTEIRSLMEIVLDNVEVNYLMKTGLLSIVGTGDSRTK